MLVRWTAKRCYWKLRPDDKRWDIAPYEVVAKDERSVVVRLLDSPDVLTPRLAQIVFDDDHYWTLPVIAPDMPEAFRRVDR